MAEFKILQMKIKNITLIQHSLAGDRQEMKEREARSTLGLPVTLSAAATFEIDSAGTVLNSYAVATAAVSS